MSPILTTMNPATGEEIKVEATPLDVTTEMLERARHAFRSWKQKSVAERLAYVRELRHVLVDHLEEGIEVIQKDTGKPKVEAITADLLMVLDGIKHMEAHALRELKTKRVKTPITLIGKKSYVSYDPRGVVLVISPWNFPFQLAMIPVISALVAGNCVILKPSEVTPLVGKWIESMCKKAGFPEHVVQVAHGDKEMGAKLITESPDYIFFTGSVRTGRIIQQEAAKLLIPTTLELGGKDPMIVFGDANLERAVKGAIWGSLTNSGQVCMSVERVYVERSVYQKFVDLIKKEVANLKQGQGDDDDLGSMTFVGQMDIVRSHVLQAVQSGAILECGTHPDQWKQQKSLWVEPIILTDVDQSMDVMQEETFGPIISILPFDHEEEAIQLANDSRFGLNASVWSKDIQKAKRVATQLVSGSVLINDVIVSVANHYLPFGGAKESGIGRYHGESGLRMFCHEKSILIERSSKKTEVNWFPYNGKLSAFKKLVHGLYGRQGSVIQFAMAYLELLRKSR